ncbi:exported protein of unknown function [Modestobacter italicus]|uniref:Uncharacterized protein n=1 Tax=Modestobacter italicus (strain DSM 44449 / CECT 9708 / BC 501) TaxID=2732864 RepID=I4EW65_MODI5|nr:exported protein of unknown function [Modestobacter marinus]
MRASGRLPLPAVRLLAAWLVHLVFGGSTPVRDVRADELRPLAGSVPRVLAALDPALADDRDLAAAVADCVAELSGRPRSA